MPADLVYSPTATKPVCSTRVTRDISVATLWAPNLTSIAPQLPSSSLQNTRKRRRLTLSYPLSTQRTLESRISGANDFFDKWDAEDTRVISSTRRSHIPLTVGLLRAACRSGNRGSDVNGEGERIVNKYTTQRR